MRIERAFRIVGVDHTHQIETENTLGLFDSGVEACRLRDVVTGREEVTGIEAIGERQVSFARSKIADGAQFVELSADLAARADCVLKQHSQPGRAEAASRFGQTQHE